MSISGRRRSADVKPLSAVKSLVLSNWKGRVTAMNKMLSLLAIVALSSPLLSETKPAHPSQKWEKAIAAFEDADKKSQPPQGAVLFIGASGIARWKTLKEDFPGHTVINRGFGGSQIEDSTYFAERIIIPYKPKTIVFQAGGNDLNAGKSPEQTAKDFEALVTKVRTALPDVRILFTEQAPSSKRWDQREKQQELNRLVKDFTTKGKNLGFIPMWNEFIGPDGKPIDALYVEDKLHNNEAGYKIRTRIVKTFLDTK
jgi:lysophospholipase L1-like esterase